MLITWSKKFWRGVSSDTALEKHDKNRATNNAWTIYSYYLSWKKTFGQLPCYFCLQLTLHSSYTDRVFKLGCLVNGFNDYVVTVNVYRKVCLAKNTFKNAFEWVTSLQWHQWWSTRLFFSKFENDYKSLIRYKTKLDYAIRYLSKNRFVHKTPT